MIHASLFKINLIVQGKMFYNKIRTSATNLTWMFYRGKWWHQFSTRLVREPLAASHLRWNDSEVEWYTWMVQHRLWRREKVWKVCNLIWSEMKFWDRCNVSLTKKFVTDSVTVMAGYADVVVLRHPEPGAVSVSWSSISTNIIFSLSLFFRIF